MSAWMVHCQNQTSGHEPDIRSILDFSAKDTLLDNAHILYNKQEI